jgi:DNA polymerase I-like protein with 3'-5' exonuclease and polymerase domains
VLAFQLNCRPTKDALDAIGKAHFRTLAKNVIFGIAYGRGAKAIALQAKEQGISVTPDDAQMVIDAIFEMYPELVPFFEEAKTRALREKWLCHSHGRFRRFPSARDFKLEGEFERQAMNFPIQGMIASCVDRGLAYLVDAIERRGLGNDIRLLLQIHDAGLVEVRYDLVPYAIKLIEWAMVEMVEIWPTDLAGIPRGDGPYRLGLEFEVSKHWGEKFAYDEAVRVGLDPKYAKAPPKPTEFATKA